MIKYDDTNEQIYINGSHTQLMFEAIGIFMYVFDMQDDREKRTMDKTITQLIDNYYEQKGVARDKREESYIETYTKAMLRKHDKQSHVDKTM